MTRAADERPGDERKSLFALIGDLPGLVTDLVKGEIQSLKQEAIGRAKAAGIGVWLLVGAAVFAYFAFWVLIATVILAIAQALPPWLAALIVGVVLLVIAGVLGLVGFTRLRRGVPPVPQQSVESVKDDVKALKGVGTYDR